MAAPRIAQLFGAAIALGRVALGIAELWVRVRTAPVRRKVQSAPKRPDRIDMPGVLARLVRRKQELGCIGMVDVTVRPALEHVEDGQLAPLFILAMVIG